MFRNPKEELKKELEKILEERYNGKISAEELLKPNRRRDAVSTKLRRRKIWFTWDEGENLDLLELAVKLDEINKGFFSLPFAIVKWLKNLIVKK